MVYKCTKCGSILDDGRTYPPGVYHDVLHLDVCQDCKGETVPQKIKRGDVVTLKSGGPKMTVSSYNDYTKTFYCMWFDNDGEYQSVYFDPEVLKVVQE